MTLSAAKNCGTETRVVRLFEIWRPDIGEVERAELGTLFNWSRWVKQATGKPELAPSL